MSETFDLVVIGAGPGGYEAALEAARRGMKTALAERHLPGGTCLNYGCVPTKRLLHVSEFFRRMKDCRELGLDLEPSAWNWERLGEGTWRIVTQLREGILELLAAEGVRLYQGEAVLAGEHSVRVGSEELRVRNILIATGSAQAPLSVPGAELPGVVSEEELLCRKTLFNRLTIIGAGAAGVEFASVYSSMGKRVILLEAADRILPGMDREISRNLEMILKGRGVEIHKNSSVVEITENIGGNGLTLHFASNGGSGEIISDGILNASGRRPVLVPMAPEISLRTSKGTILVDENGETSCPGIYAVGDVTGPPMLACRAAAQGRRAVSHMLGGFSAVNTALVPNCIYTDPEIASVGLDEAEARKLGMEVLVYRYPMSANARSWISAEDRGFIKAVACRRTHKLLGAQLMCARAVDLIGEFTLSISLGVTVEQMAAVIRPHPTFGEAVGEMCREMERMF